MWSTPGSCINDTRDEPGCSVRCDERLLRDEADRVAMLTLQHVALGQREVVTDASPHIRVFFEKRGNSYFAPRLVRAMNEQPRSSADRHCFHPTAE